MPGGNEAGVGVEWGEVWFLYRSSGRWRWHLERDPSDSNSCLTSISSSFFSLPLTLAMYFGLKITVFPPITRNKQSVKVVLVIEESGRDLVNPKAGELGYGIRVGIYKFQFLLF